MVTEAYERYRSNDSGAVADYIPVLAQASPDLFGIAVVGPWGRSFEIGDVAVPFSIQSVSKPFVFALVCDTLGYEAARLRLGVNSTGFPFNSLMAVELNAERTMNPLVNAGAIATTSLAPGATLEEKWESIRERLSQFAGRELAINAEVYASESATNMRNHGIAHLLRSYERLYFDADEATDIYTRQCSLDVTAHDLAVMAATLANGGVNPVTGVTVIGPGVCRRVLAVMASAGLYELSGDWLYQIGVPGKSGVSGGIVTVSPGKGGLATYSPPLDSAGNSVRGQLATKDLAERLGLNLFASVPAEGPHPSSLDVGDGHHGGRLGDRLGDVLRTDAVDVAAAAFGEALGSLHPALGHEDPEVGALEPEVARRVDAQEERLVLVGHVVPVVAAAGVGQVAVLVEVPGAGARSLEDAFDAVRRAPS